MTVIKRVDANQQTIVTEARKMGFGVAITSTVGNGFPDTVMNWLGENHLCEIKNGSPLTIAQIKFISSWPGAVYMLNDVEDLIKLRTGFLPPITLTKEQLKLIV